MERVSSSVTDLQNFRYKPRDSPRDILSRDASRDVLPREPVSDVLTLECSRDSIITSRDGGMLSREHSFQDTKRQTDESDSGG